MYDSIVFIHKRIYMYAPALLAATTSVHGLATGLCKHLTVNCRGRRETLVFCSLLFGRDRITTGLVTLSNTTEIMGAKFKNSVINWHKHSKGVFSILRVSVLIRPLISCSGWVAFP
jgi:hypothetical protein